MVRSGVLHFQAWPVKTSIYSPPWPFRFHGNPRNCAWGGWENSGTLNHPVQKHWTRKETHFGLFTSEKLAVGTYLL